MKSIQCRIWMGYGWNPYLWEDSYVSTSVEGTYIDLPRKEASLGRRSVGYLTENRDKRKSNK
jgi:hypothetical protein